MRITDHRVIDTALNDAGGITADAAGICMSIDRLHVIEGFQLIQIEVFQIQRIFFCGCVDSAAIYTFDNTAEILAADAAGILFTAQRAGYLTVSDSSAVLINTGNTAR